MNVLGHAFVAERLRPGDAEHALGAILPDLASMAGVRLARPPAGSALADGVRSHHAADAAFHSRPAFLAGAAAIRSDLLAAGVGTGPARAVGHVGFELLLDGTLVGTATEEAYRDALRLAGSRRAVDAVAPDARARWYGFVDRFTPPPALHYDDPHWVAERLVAILRHRPRLAVEARDRHTVSAVLAHHADDVRRAAPSILDSVAGLQTG